MKFAFTIGFLICATTVAHAKHPCADAAAKKAVELTNFHLNDGTPPDSATKAEVIRPVAELAPVRSLKGPSQFDMLEAWVGVYKAKYRTRLIYFQTQGQCVLMGQEIFEASNPN